MKTVTVTFTNSTNKTQAATFDMYPRSEREEAKSRDGWQVITPDDWQDETSSTVEKKAAQDAGFKPGEVVYYVQTN